jgi:ATP-dependent DNA helicase RecG
MFFFKRVLCANEGTRRMRDTMRENGLPDPLFTEIETDGLKVNVTLKNNVAFRKQYVDTRAVEILGHKKFMNLNERERILVNFTAEKGKITVSDASRIAKGGWDQLRKILNGLVETGIMNRVSPMGIDRDPKAHYVLRPNETTK